MFYRRQKRGACNLAQALILKNLRSGRGEALTDLQLTETQLLQWAFAAFVAFYDIKNSHSHC